MLSEKINPAAYGGRKGLTHIGQIILSTTLDTVDKVIEFYGGEWEPFGAGQVLVGAGTIPATKEGEGDRVFTAGNTGGEYEHTLTTDEMPSHTHSSSMHNTDGAGHNYLNVEQAAPGTGLTVGNTGTKEAGGGKPHNNMQPYVVVYMWHRVA